MRFRFILISGWEIMLFYARQVNRTNLKPEDSNIVSMAADVSLDNVSEEICESVFGVEGLLFLDLVFKYLNSDDELESILGIKPKDGENARAFELFFEYISYLMIGVPIKRNDWSDEGLSEYLTQMVEVAQNTPECMSPVICPKIKGSLYKYFAMETPARMHIQPTIRGDSKLNLRINTLKDAMTKLETPRLIWYRGNDGRSNYQREAWKRAAELKLQI